MIPLNSAQVSGIINIIVAQRGEKKKRDNDNDDDDNNNKRV